MSPTDARCPGHERGAPSRVVCGRPALARDASPANTGARGKTATCNLFASQDPATSGAETRAVRLHGHATSVRLEAPFWAVLEELATVEGMFVARFVATLHDEVLDRQGEVSNLASLLRVTRLHWTRNKELYAAQVRARELHMTAS